MLFSSYEFVLAFLPAAVLAVFLARTFVSARAGLIALFAASLFFYAWWNPPSLGLLLASMLFNYLLGTLIECAAAGSGRARLYVWVGVVFNLGAIGYFKYANFFIDTVANFTTISSGHLDVVLPLAISFFTFQQIAYLVDVYSGRIRQLGFLRYIVIVVFFPHLIAGPIVHFRDVADQFTQNRFGRLQLDDFLVGITFFTLGLFKKVVIADGMSPFVGQMFYQVGIGNDLTFVTAWAAGLSYCFQIYFDFSGYSDMAVGLARIFGIRISLNFNSPYKSTSIVGFWRGWHMTLSDFLRNYLYVPLGGSRHGAARRYINILIVMLLGGLWHGAAWTFVIWGALHGVMIVATHLWIALMNRLRLGGVLRWRIVKIGGWLVTFIFVIVAWVFFRADSFDLALKMLGYMFDPGQIVFGESQARWFGPLASILEQSGVIFISEDDAITRGLNLVSMQHLGLLFIVLLATLLLPNTQQWIDPRSNYVHPYEHRPYLKAVPLWKPTVFYCAMIGLCLGGLLTLLGGPSEFLYFRF